MNYFLLNIVAVVLLVLTDGENPSFLSLCQQDLTTAILKAISSASGLKLPQLIITTGLVVLAVHLARIQVLIMITQQEEVKFPY